MLDRGSGKQSVHDRERVRYIDAAPAFSNLQTLVSIR